MQGVCQLNTVFLLVRELCDQTLQLGFCLGVKSVGNVGLEVSHLVVGKFGLGLGRDHAELRVGVMFAGNLLEDIESS